ncbi:MAG: CHRD domain-containing protein [Acidimicrobiia bacterium]
MRSLKIPRAVAIMSTLALALALALPAFGGGRPLSAELTGENEVPASGSAATGTANFTLNQGQGEICAEIESSGYQLGEVVVAGHIHRGEAGAVNPPFVDFMVTSASHSICVDVDPAIVKEIRQNPGAFYFNLHSNLTPSGVIRGQLSK